MPKISEKLKTLTGPYIVPKESTEDEMNLTQIAATATATTATAPPLPPFNHGNSGIDLIKYLEHIRPFNGDPSDLSRFISNIDNAVSLTNHYNETIQCIIGDIIKDKLVDEARVALYINYNLKHWSEIKIMLCNHFGNFKNSSKLYNEMRKIEFGGNLNIFYKNLSYALAALNKKCVEEGKSFELANHAISARDHFIEALPEKFQIILGARTVDSLQEAYFILADKGYTEQQEYKNTRHNDQKGNKNFNSRQNLRNNGNNNYRQNYNNNFRQNDYRPNFQRNNNFNQFNETRQNSNPFRQITIGNQNFPDQHSNQTFNQNGFQNNSNPNGNFNRNFNPNNYRQKPQQFEPMDVDQSGQFRQQAQAKTNYVNETEEANFRYAASAEKGQNCPLLS